MGVSERTICFAVAAAVCADVSRVQWWLWRRTSAPTAKLNEPSADVPCTAADEGIGRRIVEASRIVSVERPRWRKVSGFGGRGHWGPEEVGKASENEGDLCPFDGSGMRCMVGVGIFFLATPLYMFIVVGTIEARVEVKIDRVPVEVHSN